MARTEVTAIDLGGQLDYDGDSLTWTACDNVNGNYCSHTGREIILVRNDNVATQDFTVVSQEDDMGRTKDATDAAVGIGAYKAFGPYPIKGWSNAGALEFDGGAADVYVCVIRLPSSWAGR